ncbi:MAG: hypothetical protein IPO88_12010 [Nannocystis sp.]|uniref:MYXO-CTERM sorting domain-containing protein n=1 Tax=Nannocystis sp. TaxID=1962667 RepID=UPI002423FBDB|nr:MYXO-CTERM sorting domain-containing protein [Nannocystis sp.]MBK9754209.1 hypothetical protein [Nannocystis sp.]
MLPRLTVLPFLLTCLAANPALGAPDELTTAIPTSAPWYRPQVLNADAPPPLAAQPGLLYVNYDGGKMNGCGWGNNDPKNNCSVIFHGTVLPFSGDAAMRAAVVQYIRKDFSDFNIRVTDIRPGDNVDYDMEMVGDWDPAPDGGFAGVAPSIDCFNADGGEVSFTLDYSPSAGSIAKAILQEVAHTWGLEHVDSTGDLLYPTTAGVADPTYQDECFQIVQLNQVNQVVPDTGQCKQQHLQFCNSGNLQNSYRELLQTFGPSVPDLTPPTVQIVEPAADAELEGPFNLRIQAADEQSPQLLALGIVGEGPSAFNLDPAHYPSPSDLKFPLKGLAAGAYKVTVTAEDEDGNQSQTQVAFTVVGPPAPTTAGDDTGPADTSSSDGGDDTSVPTTTSASDDTGAPPVTTTPVDSEVGGDPMVESGDDGCSCRHASPSALALLLPLALGLRRRRTRGGRRSAVDLRPAAPSVASMTRTLPGAPRREGR